LTLSGTNKTKKSTNQQEDTVHQFINNSDRYDFGQKVATRPAKSAPNPIKFIIGSALLPPDFIHSSFFKLLLQPIIAIIKHGAV